MPTFVQVLIPPPPEGTVDVVAGGDGWVYAMPADKNEGALDWWETSLVPFKDETGVWCLGTPD